MRCYSKLALALTPLLLLFLVSSVDAHTIYGNAKRHYGIPALNTYINFNPAQNFGDTYRTGNTWNFDDYDISVTNANATITGLFNSPDTVTATVTGSADTESVLKIDASAYGYTHEPGSITYTGQVENTYYIMTATELQLYATHETDGDLEYEINWEGSGNGGGGGGGYTPPEPEEPTTPEQPEPEPPEPEEPEELELTPELVLLAIVAVLIGVAIIAETKKPKRIQKTKRKKHGKHKTKAGNGF